MVRPVGQNWTIWDCGMVCMVPVEGMPVDHTCTIGNTVSQLWRSPGYVLVTSEGHAVDQLSKPPLRKWPIMCQVGHETLLTVNALLVTSWRLRLMLCTVASAGWHRDTQQCSERQEPTCRSNILERRDCQCLAGSNTYSNCNCVGCSSSQGWLVNSFFLLPSPFDSIWVGTCKSEIFVRIKSRIESAATIRIRI